MEAAATLNDVKGAVSSAWNQWFSDKPGLMFYKLESGKVINILHSGDGNYGIPNLYPMDKGDFHDLEAWWKEECAKYQGVGSVYPPQCKSPRGDWGVNVVYKRNKGEKAEFNFHVPVTN